MLSMRQIDRIPDREHVPIAECDASLVAAAERSGVRFTEETEYDEPGPTRWAAVELDDGTRGVLVYHYAHEPPFCELRFERAERPPPMIVLSLLHELGLAPAVHFVASSWDQ